MRAEVTRAIKRSTLRLKVLRCLWNLYPESTYISELARLTRSDPANITGTVRGLGDRYAIESSLVHLELVEMRPTNNGFVYYRISDENYAEVDEIMRVFNTENKLIEVELE